MKQFFLRAVKAQLPVKANTDLSHRPALVAESLSLCFYNGIPQLYTGREFM